MSADKFCNGCLTFKPLSGFFRNRSKADGYEGRCKECMTPVIREWQAANPDTVRANHRAFMAATRDSQKQAIYNAVHTEIRASRLPKASECDCTHCGQPAYEYHHPHGYEWEHRLTVVPLCKTCHEKEHHS